MKAAIKRDFFVNARYILERADGSVVHPEIILLGSGCIHGSNNSNETSWDVRDGSLIVFDSAGQITTEFYELEIDRTGHRLIGRFLPEARDRWHILRRLETEAMGRSAEIVELETHGPISELLSELYGGDSPFNYADMTFRDDGYPHTNLIPDVIESILDFVPTKFWLELGSMVGGSAIRVAEVAKARGGATEIVCVDPFTGDVNMWAWEQPKKQAKEWQFLRLERGRPTIYDRFMANVAAAGHKDIVLPITATSIVGVRLMGRLFSEHRLSSLPNVIYLDSAHEMEETYLELQSCWSLLPAGGILFGDDWSWDAVRTDVLKFAKTVRIDTDRRQQLAARHTGFEEQDGILLDRGQWLLVK